MPATLTITFELPEDTPELKRQMCFSYIASSIEPVRLDVASVFPEVSSHVTVESCDPFHDNARHSVKA